MANITPRSENGPHGQSLSERRGHPLARLRREMDELFDSFFTGWPAPMSMETGWARPWGLDVTAEGNEMVVRAEVPGFETNDLDVRVQGDVLTIRAERRQEAGQQHGFGRFEEAIRIPAGTDPDKVKASYHNGVLELRLPMPEEARGKRITVRGDGGEPAGQPAQSQKKATARA
jgi:HSP20 family protein